MTGETLPCNKKNMSQLTSEEKTPILMRKQYPTKLILCVFQKGKDY